MPQVRIPVARLVRLGTHALSASKGGFTAAEVRSLGIEALSVARIVLTPLLPPTVAPVVGPVLDAVEGMIASPPASVSDAAGQVIAALSGVLPVDVDIDVTE